MDHMFVTIATLCNAIGVLINRDSTVERIFEAKKSFNDTMRSLYEGVPRSVITFSDIPSYNDLIWVCFNHMERITDKVHDCLINSLLHTADYEAKRSELTGLRTLLHRVDRLDLESEKILLLVKRTHKAVKEVDKMESELALRLHIVFLSLLSEGILIQLE